MGKHIKADGTVNNVTPNDKVFTLEEMKGYIGGYLESVKLNNDLVMYVNEDGIALNLPYNQAATRVVQEHRPGYQYAIYGDVLIASLVETGDVSNELHITTSAVNEPCQECNAKTYPNVKWDLYGMTGVLCKPCFSREIDNLLSNIGGQFTLEG